MTIFSSIELCHPHFQARYVLEDSCSWGKDASRIAITKLNRVNYFVGQTNSGKSRFMRALFSQEEFGVSPYAGVRGFIADMLGDLFKVVTKEGLTDRRIHSGPPPFTAGNLLDPYHTVKYSKQTISPWLPEHLLPYFGSGSDANFGRYISNLITNLSTLHGVVHENEMIRSIIHNDMKRVRAISAEPDRLSQKEDLKLIRCYIPILRGLRLLRDELKVGTLQPAEINNLDIYHQRTVNDYLRSTGDNQNHGMAQGCEIFTGQGLYANVRNKLLGNYEDRQTIKDFEDFLQREFFPNKKLSIIPHEIEGVLKVSTGNHSERAIHNLGDGIQALISVLFPIFLKRQEHAMFFIEEPELYMHPGLQRRFMEVLLDTEHFPNHQYFLTTHSNHLLDLSLEQSNISIYHFSILPATTSQERGAEEKFLVKNVQSADFSVLYDLGVRNSGVFLANCTIFVEGITDRLYLQEYLRLYFESDEGKSDRNKYKIDTNYIFAEYAGSNITHWVDINSEELSIETERVFGKNYLIIADRDNDTKQARLNKIQEELGENHLYILKAKEIENTLPSSVIAQVVEEYEEGELPENFPKDRISYSKYKNQPLGKFINKLFTDSNLAWKRARQNGYVSENTIADKMSFCNRALKYLREVDFEDLPEETQELTRKMVYFIRESNV